MPPPSAVKATPNYMDQHPERIEFWKRIVRSDARRAVRVLALNGLNSETVEGDSVMDGMYVMAQLRELSRDAKSETWKALVDAGVITAL